MQKFAFFVIFAVLSNTTSSMELRRKKIEGFKGWGQTTPKRINPYRITTTERSFSSTSRLTNRPSTLPSTTTSSPSDTTISTTTKSPDPRPPSTTRQPLDTAQCQRSCIITTEYQPLCGTDYVTYHNIEYFNCAKRCGLDVNIYLRRTCPSLGLGETRSDKVQCIASCSILEENNQVCGSDDVTYDNLSMLQCAQKCGYNVTVKATTSCTELTTTQSPDIFQTPSTPYGVRVCMELCSSAIDEFWPVCGTNGVTYRHPRHLDCAKICGIKVELKHRAPCPHVNNPGMLGKDNQPNPLPPVVQLCVRYCNITEEINPVCGENGITYTNPSQRECSKRCGIRHDKQYGIQCNPNATKQETFTTLSPTIISKQLLGECIRVCPHRTSEYNPVCGTDGDIYDNRSHIRCAKDCGAKVEFQRYPPCPLAGDTSSRNKPSEPSDIDGNRGSANVNKNESGNGASNASNPGNRGNKQEIPRDILNELFPNMTKAEKQNEIDSKFN